MNSQLIASLVLAGFVSISTTALAQCQGPAHMRHQTASGAHVSRSHEPLAKALKGTIDQGAVGGVESGKSQSGMRAPYQSIDAPEHAILAIHNNLSGRAVGDPATELGLARIADDAYPQVLSNDPNQFADGRRAKSTSVCIRDSSGRYVAALCLNIGVSLFNGMRNMLEQFCAASGEGMRETLDPANAEALRERIDRFAVSLSTTPQALRTEQRRALMQELKQAGFLEVHKSMEIIAAHLGVSRATVYNDAK